MRHILLAVLFGLILCTTVWAQSHTSGTEEVAPDGKASEDHDILPDNAILLGEMEDNGIVAMAWLYRVPSSPDEAGQQEPFPYLLFLRFLSVENNTAVEKGLVAHKLENAEGEFARAIKMQFKSGYFVDGLERLSAGRYILHIGCKLEDEKKRQFQYELVIR